MAGRLEEGERLMHHDRRLMVFALKASVLHCLYYLHGICRGIFATAINTLGSSQRFVVRYLSGDRPWPL